MPWVLNTFFNATEKACGVGEGTGAAGTEEDMMGRRMD
jgi:hypothetical protein